MKRAWVICSLLAMVALAAAAYGAYGYREMAALSLQVETTEKKLAETEARIHSGETRLAELLEKERQLDAARKVFSGGSALKEIESAVAAAANPGADQMLALGAARLLAKGPGAEASAAFKKALELIDLESRLNAACTAQAGLAASGEKVEPLASCRISAEPAGTAGP
jgi:uncharacterized protein YhaN